MARPRKTIDVERLRTLAMVGASFKAMAAACSVSVDTLERRYAELIEEARGHGQCRVLGKLFTNACNGNQRAIEFFLINTAGWTTRPEVQVTTNVLQNLGEAVPEARLLEHSKQMAEFARSATEPKVLEAAPSEGSGQSEVSASGI